MFSLSWSSVMVPSIALARRSVSETDRPKPLWLAGRVQTFQNSIKFCGVKHVPSPPSLGPQLLPARASNWDHLFSKAGEEYSYRRGSLARPPSIMVLVEAFPGKGGIW